jgi:hypothetical protein
MKLDNLHYNFTKIDGFNKPFNFIISEREAGKSTALWIKIYRKWKNEGKPSIVLRRLIADVTETYIQDIETVLNKFLDVPIEITFKKGDLKTGIVDVYIDEKLFVRVMGISAPINRIKSLIVRNVGYMVMDEFICNMRMGEKYLVDEAFKFKEIYNTFQRESDGLKCYFMGNPYSMYNPYFAWIGVDTLALKRGTIVTGDVWAVECYEICEELKAAILARNPLYKFSDEYTQYAFGGQAINDINIRINPKQPDGFKLRFVFRMENKYIGVFQATIFNHDTMFWVSQIEYTGDRRKIYCFDFAQLADHSVLLSSGDKIDFSFLKQAIRLRAVEFQNLECSYLMEEIYSSI